MESSGVAERQDASAPFRLSTFYLLPSAFCLLFLLAPLVPYRRSHGPEDPVSDQPLEHRVTPHALIVAVGRVEDPALALFTHPGPGLAAAIVDALHQHGFIRIDLGVN